ncbi:uncharacterized protein LOC131063536 [Cryptomeria japonica]|uniref:uncharacterized protein LOC131063536 n=1 Tax=Cryptomeria japonica TaxID=3369 RepID=UPI0027DA8744|nr:uncharacterized protein LOC131063536 [Cryptomeria japonica]
MDKGESQSKYNKEEGDNFNSVGSESENGASWIQDVQPDNIFEQGLSEISLASPTHVKLTFLEENEPWWGDEEDIKKALAKSGMKQEEEEISKKIIDSDSTGEPSTPTHKKRKVETEQDEKDVHCDEEEGKDKDADSKMELNKEENYGEGEERGNSENRHSNPKGLESEKEALNPKEGENPNAEETEQSKDSADTILDTNKETENSEAEEEMEMED